MAKSPKNAEKFPIRWDGTIDSPFLGTQNNETPDSETLIWGSNEYTWGDVQFIQEIVDGLGTGRRRQERLDRPTCWKKAWWCYILNNTEIPAN